MESRCSARMVSFPLGAISRVCQRYTNSDTRRRQLVRLARLQLRSNWIGTSAIMANIISALAAAMTGRNYTKRTGHSVLLLSQFSVTRRFDSATNSSCLLLSKRFRGPRNSWPEYNGVRFSLRWGCIFWPTNVLTNRPITRNFNNERFKK